VAAVRQGKSKKKVTTVRQGKSKKKLSSRSSMLITMLITLEC
jgi:hypothetical protein